MASSSHQPLQAPAAALSSPAPTYYISSSSASALVSDLGPTSLTTPALEALNIWLDELLVKVVDGASSLDPEVIKTKGVGRAFGDSAAGAGAGAGVGGVGIKTLSLGRDAVNEAELELKAWKDGIIRRRQKQQQQQQQDGENGVEGAGGDPTVEAFRKYPRGLMPRVGEGEPEGEEQASTWTFPTREAIEMLRYRVVSYCTLASDKPTTLPDSVRESTLRWSAAGGSRSESVLAPASLYLTALVEHVGERTLAALARVVARDSSTKGKAELQDVYVALCEDEAMWGLFKRMEVKRMIEAQITGSQGADDRCGGGGLTDIDSASQPQAIEYTPSGGVRASPSTGEFPGAISKRGSGVPAGGATSLGHARIPSAFGRSAVAGGAGGHSRTASAMSGRREWGAPFAAPSSSPLTVDSGKANIGAAATGSRRDAFMTPSPTVSTFHQGGRQASNSLEASRSGRDRQDEFEALIKSGQTMKVSLTPSRLKGFDASGRAAPSPPKNTVVSRSASVSSATHVKSTSSPQSLRLQPKSALVAAAEDDDEEELAHDVDDGKYPADVQRKESLKDVLSSVPPWPEQTEPTTSTTTTTMTPGGSRRPSQGVSETGPSVQPRDASSAARAPTRDMADFLMSTAPPGEVLRSNSQAPMLAAPIAPASLHDNYPGRRPSARSESSEVDEGKKTKTVTSDLADFFANTAPPSSSSQDASSRLLTPSEPVKSEHKPGRFRSLFGGSKKAKKEVDNDVANDARLGGGDGIHGSANSTSGPASRGLNEQASRASLTALKPVTRPTRQPPPPTAMFANGLGTGSASTNPAAILPVQRVGQDTQANGDTSSTNEQLEDTSRGVPTENGEPSKNVSSGATAPAPSPITPNTVSLSDLTSFRNLFQHAASADECRMLLDAALTQWGVGSSTEGEGETPDGRVTAWLLTGREGPSQTRVAPRGQDVLE